MLARPAHENVPEPYTSRMNIGKLIADLATAPVKVGIAVADAGYTAAGMALGLVKQTVGYESSQLVDPITDLFPLRGALVGANRVAELTESDRALGRMLARGGPADKLSRPGGVLDLLTEPGGLLDRISVEGSSLERVLEPGGLIDRLLDEDGPLERLLAEDGVIERLLIEDGVVERLFAEDGIIDKLTVKGGPLEQLTEAAEILSRLQPVVETLTPTTDTLESAVDALNRMVGSLSTITDRIPRRRPKALSQSNAEQEAIGG